MNPQVGVGVLIFNKDNEILLGKRFNSHGEGCWGPPGGHLDFGESLEACAIREVYEETGLLIDEPHFLGMTNDIFESETKHYLSIFMKASYPREQKINNQEPHKTLSWQWFPLETLPFPLFLPLHNLTTQKGYGGWGKSL
jgi:8-oxo-dGTP diphosphatase